MLEHLRAPFKKLIEPIAKALIAIGLTANAVTVIGAVGTIVVAIATTRESENSRPTVNKSTTTPISASKCTRST